MNVAEVSIITFASTHAAMEAQRILTEGRIVYTVIPTPVEVSSDCGIALHVAREDTGASRKLLAGGTNGLPVTFHSGYLREGRLVVADNPAR